MGVGKKKKEQTSKQVSPGKKKNNIYDCGTGRAHGFQSARFSEHVVDRKTIKRLPKNVAKKKKI